MSDQFNFQAEHGGVAFVDLFGKKKDENGNIQVVRIGVNAKSDTVMEALTQLMEAIPLAAEKFNLHPFNPFNTGQTPSQPAGQSKPAAPAAPKVPAPAGAPKAPPAAKAPAPAAPEAEGGVWGVVRVEVTPKVGGKTEVKFYGNDRKSPVNEYAYTTISKTPEQLAAMFPVGWETMFESPAVFDYPLLVTWKQGREKQGGGFWKDIVSIISPGS